MKLNEFKEACKEFVNDPATFGYDAMSDMLHYLADDISEEELVELAKLMLIDKL